MKTYLRLLSYARPLTGFLPQYILFALLAVLFGLVQFTLLIPLFDVLFNQVEPAQLTELSQFPPDFSFTLEYFERLFKYHFDQVIENQGKEGALIFVCIILVSAVFLSNLFGYLSAIILAQVRANVVSNLRMEVFERVTQLHIGYFSNERKGDLMSRITNDVQEVENSVVNTLKVVFREPASIIGIFIILFYMSFQLTLFSLILLPVSGIIISEITRRLKKKAKESQESLGNIVTILDETISGMRVINAFNAQKYITGSFKKEVDSYAKINVSMARKNELGSPLSQFMGVVVVAALLFYGGSLVLNEQSELKASEFITFLILYSQIMPPAKSISIAFSSIQRGLASGERIFRVIDTKPAIKDKPGAPPIQNFNDNIVFNNVSFSYEKDLILKDINLVIKKGETIALVGPSGGGKSTLADLIPRFYDPVYGDVSIDGKSLKDVQLDSIRKLMGIVTQESILFNDTIANNIAFGIPDAKKEDIIAAAKIANAHDFIMQTPEGYDSKIGDRGTKLSGGQRQRISIARAVLKNPPILILDEATSALDTESERLVQEALTNLMKKRTSIVIAHRLSTIQHADQIVVIQNGAIVEKGNHEELLLHEGLYKKLNMMQAI
ncbi:MAG: ABC transporter transmembrane domain-containing protein [Bacteroidota bacterium]|nr:ABC transporter transmembrane domain-containing protein [Bacteroidota bacterium]